MGKSELRAAIEAFRSADSILITSHTNPDGDAIGTMLALRHFLDALGVKTVKCVCHDPVPARYKFLPGAESVVTPNALAGDFDLGVIVDVSEFDRVGDAADLMRELPTLVVLDHHLGDNPCGSINFVDPTYSSASEIILELFNETGLNLSAPAAECIYVGLTTDTGGFRFANTNPRAHRSAAVLMEAGVDIARISAQVFDQFSLPKLRLLQRVLARMELSDDGAVAHSFITLEDMGETCAKGEDIDGLVNFGRNIEGVDVGMLFKEVDAKSVKVSLRSNRKFNSAQALKSFGGGGHAGAAGATLTGTLQEVRSTILSAVSASLKGADE